MNIDALVLFTVLGLTLIVGTVVAWVNDFFGTSEWWLPYAVVALMMSAFVAFGYAIVSIFGGGA